MSQKSNNQNHNQSQSASTSKHTRPKVNPNKTINYIQDGRDRHQKKG